MIRYFIYFRVCFNGIASNIVLKITRLTSFVSRLTILFNVEANTIIVNRQRVLNNQIFLDLMTTVFNDIFQICLNDQNLE